MRAKGINANRAIFRTIVAAGVLVFASRLPAADGDGLIRLTFVGDAEQSTAIEGKVVVEAADGGVLFLGRDGRLWSVTPKQKPSAQSTGRPFSPLSADELGRSLGESLGPNFEIVKTRHYV